MKSSKMKMRFLEKMSSNYKARVELNFDLSNDFVEKFVANSKTDILDVSDAPLSSCQEHYDQGDRADGVYTIQVTNTNHQSA